MTNTIQTTSPSTRRAGIPASAYLLTACIGVIGSNSLALGPIAPAVAGSFGAGVPAVMIAAAAFGLGTAASAFFLARHIDRLGAIRMLRIALLVLAAALAACALAPVLAVLVAAQCVAGLAAGVALPAIYTLAAVVAPPGRESETIGVVLTGWTLSMVAGVSLSAVIADHFGWRLVYGVVAALACLMLAALVASRLRVAPVSAPAQSPFAALRVPGVKPLLVACAAFMAAFYGVYGYLGDHLHNGLGRPISAGGLATLAYGAGFGSAAFLDGLIDRYGARRAAPAAFLAVAAVYGAMAASGGAYPLLVATVFLWGLANHFGLNVLIMRLTAADPGRRGAIMGLNSGVTYLALFAGTMAMGPLYSAYGFGPLALAGLALTLVSVAASLAGGTERN